MLNPNSTKKEKSILEILHIIYRRKSVVIISVVTFLVLSVLYNQFSSPVYESVALLKKEVANDKSTGNELLEIVKLQTQDMVETEMELVKTGDVLNGVIDELKLCIQLKEIVTPDGNSFEVHHVFTDFPDSGNTAQSPLLHPGHLGPGGLWGDSCGVRLRIEVVVVRRNA